MRLNKNETVKNDFYNYVQIMTHDNYLKDKFRLNLFSNMIEVSDVFWNLDSHYLSDDDVICVRDLVSTVYWLDREENIYQAISNRARELAYNPMVDKLSNLKWDGVPRLDRLLPEYLGAETSEYTTAVTKMMFFAAIQRIMNPGCKYDNCVILADKEQGGGKSTLIRYMALSDEYYCSLKQVDNDEKAFRLIRTAWIIELEEMVATKKAESIEAIKRYLSQKQDSYCEKYEKITKIYPRHQVFIGTTNKPQFLPDDMTGNRRFYPVMCDKTKAIRHPVEDEIEARAFVEQCYAEAMEVGAAEGWPLVLDKKFDEELELLRRESTPEDTKVGVIQDWLDNTTERAVCTRMIYYECLNKDNDNAPEPTRWLIDEISDILNLKIKGWEKLKGKNGKDSTMRLRSPYGTQRVWVRCKPDVNESVNKIVNEGVNEVPDGFEFIEKSPFDD